MNKQKKSNSDLLRQYGMIFLKKVFPVLIVIISCLFVGYKLELTHSKDKQPMEKVVASSKTDFITTKSYEETSLGRSFEVNSVEKTKTTKNIPVRTTPKVTERPRSTQPVNRHLSSTGRSINVLVTAYDLTYASCGKSPSHPAYGLTATGYSLRGKNREQAMTIAVDPRVIPLGTKVRIHFKDASMQKYNGTYTARDTGGAIGGHHIDLFMGAHSGAHAEALQLGRRSATLEFVE